jgi:prevent-host-death family protein
LRWASKAAAIDADQNPMSEIIISEFRTHLHSILRRVQKSKRPVLITRFGIPVAEVRPVANRKFMGSMKSETKIVGDIVSPASDPDDWEVLRD